jgi:hypothetical protein
MYSSFFAWKPTSPIYQIGLRVTAANTVSIFGARLRSTVGRSITGFRIRKADHRKNCFQGHLVAVTPISRRTGSSIRRRIGMYGMGTAMNTYRETLTPPIGTCLTHGRLVVNTRVLMPRDFMVCQKVPGIESILIFADRLLMFAMVTR